MDLLEFSVVSWRICMGRTCPEYVYAFCIAGILVSSLPLVVLFDFGPEPLFSFLSFPSNTVNFLGL